MLGDYLHQIQEDPEKANKVYKDNCEQRGHGRSCGSYGTNLLYGHGAVANAPEALSYYVKGCDNNDPTACDFAGKLLVGFDSKQSQGITEDPVKGLEYLEKGCHLPDRSHLFEMSESCFAASFMLATGFKVATKDVSRAIPLAARACDLGKVEGCQLAAELYHKQGDKQNSNVYYKRFKTFKKQIEENNTLEMQRT